ncbi:MAG: hypothetical protein K0Q86_2131, partial [Arthrobacter koreensis]|nr:hypothetical protein [Arthrobacter koreensis]
MKTGKLALLATLTGALVFGGLTPAGAVSTDQPVSSQQAPDTGVESPAATPDESEQPVQETPTLLPSPSATDLVEPQEPSEPAVPSPSPSPEDTGESDDEDDGYEYVPVGEGHVVPGPDTPLITEPDGSVRSAVESEHDHVEPMLARGGAASMLGAPARAGNIKVTLVRSTVNGNGNLVNLTAARNSIYSANSYWRSMSDNRLSLSIASERVHYSASANANDDYATVMNKIAKELKWVDNPYTALVVFVPTADLKSGGYGGILGGGWTVGGTAGRILMPAPSSFTNNVVTHEVGHVLGLLHANSLQCTNGRSDVGAGSNGRWADGACSSREYGDTTDLMGSAQYNQPVINSYFWDAGNFGRGNEITDAGQAGTPRTFTLRPWGGTSANRAVKFTDPRSGDVYYIELRQPAGYDQYLQSGPSGNRGIKIVKTDEANSWAVNSLIIPPSTRPFAGYYNGNHAWQAGQTFTTHTGTTVKVNSVSASSATVTISAVPSIPSAADVVTIAPSGDLMHYPANTQGGLSSPRRIGVGWANMISAHAVDWNGDGVIDVLAQSRNGTLQLYAGLASGGFRSPVTVGNGWAGFRISVGKWTSGDKLPGVIAIDPRGRTYSYRNLSGGYLSGGALIGTGAEPRLFAVSDLNGDGVPELVSVLDDGTLISQVRNSSGNLGAAVRAGAGWGSASSLIGVTGFTGSSSRGLLATFSTGKLSYYPADARGALSYSISAGVGWNGYRLLNSQRDKALRPSIASDADVVTLSGGNLRKHTV